MAKVGVISRIFAKAVAIGLVAASATMASGQSLPASVSPVAGDDKAADINVGDWLKRLHDASRQRAFVGTFVVSAGSAFSSSRIWHACDGIDQVERVESLTGVPRSTFRRNDQVVTFLPESRVAVTEKRESLGLFPNIVQTDAITIASFYRVKAIGRDRVAGHEADVAQLNPVDGWRYGYRVWTEKKSGLVVKLQTLNGDGQVMEQAAFSELQLGTPVSMAALTRMMGDTDGYRVEKTDLVKTTAAAEGWVMKTEVPGFKSLSCLRRPDQKRVDMSHTNTIQWVFSDGLATVSVFIEDYDPRHHVRPGLWVLGATHTLKRRMAHWWLTIVGEVPPATLAAFAHGLDRK
jgi:sigma-E factor negative regulatory protein RseB